MQPNVSCQAQARVADFCLQMPIFCIAVLYFVCVSELFILRPLNELLVSLIFFGLPPLSKWPIEGLAAGLQYK